VIVTIAQLDVHSLEYENCSFNIISAKYLIISYINIFSKISVLYLYVSDGPVILESPVHPVTEGDPLTLRCLLHNTKSSDLTAGFYKDGLLLQNQTTGEMIIPTVSKSDEGLYHCKIPEKGESPQSWISIRGEKALYSAMNLVGVSVGVSLTLLFIFVVLILLWFYKTNKGLKIHSAHLCLR
uniref:Ig-like domain-containing protein n=1 Tax=Astyanax mexicanus TaxID=7994 RepID=A0A3B1J1H3_ASTMX